VAPHSHAGRATDAARRHKEPVALTRSPLWELNCKLFCGNKIRLKQMPDLKANILLQHRRMVQ